MAATAASAASAAAAVAAAAAAREDTLASALELDRCNQLETKIETQLERTMQARDLPKAVALSEKTAKETEEVQGSWSEAHGSTSSISFTVTVAKAKSALGL